MTSKNTFVSAREHLAESECKPGEMTFTDCMVFARNAGVSAGTAVIAEAMAAGRMEASEVIDALFDVFDHNRRALETGRSTGASRFLGQIGRELTEPGAPAFTGDILLDRAVTYTLAAQVGNHSIGLQPCAGTGDACTYTGMMQAMLETVEDRELIAPAAALMLKLGTLFREGKSTTGCNMEGFGAGAAASAAAFTELGGGDPSMVERAVVLAVSPTIAVPCTPRVMVPGLCATHIGGGVVVGKLASYLAITTDIRVTISADHMIALAAAVHPLSAAYVVPEVTRHMEPFFYSLPEADAMVVNTYEQGETEEKASALKEADLRIRDMAKRARSILRPFDEPVAGGSSLAVGSPANTARLAHYLARGRIRSVRIEMSPGMFDRRALNTEAVLAAAIFGSAPGDTDARKDIFRHMEKQGIKAEIMRVDQSGLVCVSIRTDGTDSMVAAENLGGGRIRVLDFEPSDADISSLASGLKIEFVK